MKIIINADDFGFSKSINEGIIDAYREGLISSTTIMMNMPYAEDAIRKWQEYQTLGLGLHINLTQGSPLCDNLKSLVDQNGQFYHHKKVENEEVDITYEDAYTEIKAQIEKLLSYPVNVDHLDHHHFIYLNHTIRKALMDLSLEYRLPIRTMDASFRREARHAGIKTPDMFRFDFNGEGAKWENMIQIVNKYHHCDSMEILTHCGYVDEDTKQRTSYVLREVELNELRKLKAKGFYQEHPLSTFRDL